MAGQELAHIPVAAFSTKIDRYACELPPLFQAESSGGGITLGQQQSIYSEPVGAALQLRLLADQWTQDLGDIPPQLGTIK